MDQGPSGSPHRLVDKINQPMKAHENGGIESEIQDPGKVLGVILWGTREDYLSCTKVHER